MFFIVSVIGKRFHTVRFRLKTENRRSNALFLYLGANCCLRKPEYQPVYKTNHSKLFVLVKCSHKGTVLGPCCGAFNA